MMASKNSQKMAILVQACRQSGQSSYPVDHDDMSGETDFYLEAKSIEPPRSSRRPTWTRRDVLGPRLVGDLIIVRRRFRPSYPQIPPWLLRGVLTTVVIATIGFSLQRLLLPPPEGASGPAAVGLWPSTVPGAYGAAPGELAALAP